MNPESWGFIGTLVGAIVGAGSSILTTRINSKNAIRIQDDIEKNKRAKRFREFQRDNLLKLQDKLSDGIRLITRAHLNDLMHYKQTKKWATAMLNPELDNDIRISMRQLSIITERIDNSDLRNGLVKIRGQMSRCLLAKTYEENQAILMNLTKDCEILMGELGVILRATY